MKKALIFIAGLPGSGKSLAAAVIRKRFHAKSFKPGDIIREEVKRRGWKNTPENDKKVRLWFHDGREHLISKRLWEKIRKEEGIVVIDGLRSVKHLIVLRKLYKGKIALIKVQSSFGVRAKRSGERGRFGKLDTAQNLRKRDKSELGDLRGQKQLLERADYTIDNSNLSRKQLEKRVVVLVKSILKETT
jgi:dephospho-CoA kinase